MFSASKRCQIRGSADPKNSGRPEKTDIGDENQLFRLVKSNNTSPLKGITGLLNQGTYKRVTDLKDQFIVNCQKLVPSPCM